MNTIRSFIFIFVAAITLAACKTKLNNDDSITPALELYNSGVKKLEAGSYQKAALEFERVFFQHPGNSLTPKAELMQAYSLYLDAEYDEVVDVLDVFVKLHPRHEYIAYAYYLKALANYTQVSNVKLDQSRTRYAKSGLKEVITRFPSSKYAIDSALKIDLVNDHLAGKEMLVGRYYLKKNNPIAAISRFQTVVDKYETTTHIVEALYRLVESNLILGLKVEAEKYAGVLKHNYPDSQWHKYSNNLLTK